MINQNLLDELRILIQTPDLANKQWISEQYDSQVMNDTIQIGGDAAIVRIHNTNKGLAMSTDCTPRYVEADPFEGAKQAVAETYRNISAVGAKPLAITNCLNFGNPQKPEIMGQIVRAIQGITEASKVLDYPVVSGNVSLYNETDGKAIQPTPAIGGVGILEDLNNRCDVKFKNVDDEVYILGKTRGHLNCSLYEREILGMKIKHNAPKVDLELEKNHGIFIRKLIAQKVINACHDVSDGGMLVTLFEMCTPKLGIRFEDSYLDNVNSSSIMFGEDQSRYIISVPESNIKLVERMARADDLYLYKIGYVIPDIIKIATTTATVKELQDLNQKVFKEKL